MCYISDFYVIDYFILYKNVVIMYNYYILVTIDVNHLYSE
jgi:hypothetical protein